MSKKSAKPMSKQRPSLRNLVSELLGHATQCRHPSETLGSLDKSWKSSAGEMTPDWGFNGFNHVYITMKNQPNLGYTMKIGGLTTEIGINLGSKHQ